jgi:hypothetical protein
MTALSKNVSLPLSIYPFLIIIVIIIIYYLLQTNSSISRLNPSTSL